MSEFNCTSAILFTINPKQTITETSLGATSIGLKQGDTWSYGLKGICRLQQADYLISADASEQAGHFCIFLQALAKQQVMVKALEAMSQCILNDVPMLEGKLGHAMAKAVSTLNEAIKQGLESAIGLETGAHELSSSAKLLTESSRAC